MKLYFCYLLFYIKLRKNLLNVYIFSDLVERTVCKTKKFTSMPNVIELSSTLHGELKLKGLCGWNALLNGFMAWKSDKLGCVDPFLEKDFTDLLLILEEIEFNRKIEFVKSICGRLKIKNLPRTRVIDLTSEITEIVHKLAPVLFSTMVQCKCDSMIFQQVFSPNIQERSFSNLQQIILEKCELLEGKICQKCQVKGLKSVHFGNTLIIDLMRKKDAVEEDMSCIPKTLILNRAPYELRFLINRTMIEDQGHFTCVYISCVYNHCTIIDDISQSRTKIKENFVINPILAVYSKN